MDFIHTVAVSRTIFILAIANLTTGALIFLSCRCIPGLAWGVRLMRYNWFKSFYRVHCYIWWVFWISVVAHAVLAIMFMGFPF